VSSKTQIKLTIADVLEGRAYLRIPPVGRLLLAHWAGAPWSNKDPDACLHALQAEVEFRREREKIVHGASRLGKSVLGGIDLICATILPGRKVAAVAKSYQHVGHEWQYLDAGMKTLFRRHPQAFKRIIFRNSHNYYDFEVDTIWGATARGISVDTDDGGQLLGRELTDVVLGEGSHVSKHIFESKLLRALDSATAFKRSDGVTNQVGSISIYTTPRGYSGCSAAEWERVLKQTGKHPEKLYYGSAPWAPTVWVRPAKITENPAYSREVYEARKASLDSRAFREQYDGEMTYSSGRIYSSFEDEKHIVSMPSPEHIRAMRLGVGFDTGGVTGVSLVGIDREGIRWTLGEVLATKPPGGLPTTIGWMDEMLVDVLGPVFGTADPKALYANLYCWSVDPASQHKLELIEMLDAPGSPALIQPNTSDQKSVLLTTGRIEHWYSTDTMRIVDTCVETIDQTRKYQWKTMKHPSGVEAPVIKEPMKGHDHLLDSQRFVLIPLDEAGPLTEAVSMPSFAQAWQDQRNKSVWGPLKEAMAAGARREEQQWH
jgi:hypothetical protein